ncbi:hypothetical protein WR25_20827 [Diploscapter pachys]|uniref:Uncharacterized protein n=1 Tax=Diploscapter pachys TaxID=2018661 RepID=A0A2A2JPG2_9BILA|nr:hypothetical protein WR25_20827 [Diploscapter pachys]
MGEPSAKKPKLEGDQLPEHLNAFQEEQKRSLILIDEVQNELDQINEQASEEILKVEQKYNKLRHPHYEKRAEHIKNLPNFWSTTLLNHHQISSIINPVEEEVLKHLETLEIEEFEDIKSGFFEWLIKNVDPTLDDIAEIIKDDIWPNPLQYFLCPALDATNDTYEDFLDDEEQLEEVDDEGGSEEGSEAEGGSNKAASEDDVDEEENCHGDA